MIELFLSCKITRQMKTQYDFDKARKAKEQERRKQQKMQNLKFKASFDNAVTDREKRNQQIARKAAAESIVLLENDGTLPIEPGKVALFGGGAAMTIKGGTGSGEVNERHSVGIEEGLENAGFTVTTKDWLYNWRMRYEAGKAEHGKGMMKKMLSFDSAEMINIMANPYRLPAGRKITVQDVKRSDTDTCIYVVSRQAGECADRELEKFDYELMDMEKENIRRVVKAYKKVILVINVGCSMDMSILEEVPGINAVIYYCQQGMEGGNAFADILTGKVNPSGALSNTWVLRYDDVPYAREYAHMDGNPLEADYKEGIYVGYRYFNTFGVKTRYPFGYGMSYTTFELKYQSAAMEGNHGSIEVEAANTGTCAGKKIVQIYAHCPQQELKKETRRLIGFAKTSLLNPGEKETVKVTFDAHALSSYDETRSAYVLEAGDYVLAYGENAEQITACVNLRLDETVCLEQCQSICPSDTRIEELSKKAPLQESLSEGLPVILWKGEDIETCVYDYTLVDAHRPLMQSTSNMGCPNRDSEWEESTTETVEKWLDSLTTDEKIELLSGTGMMGQKPYLTVPGAAAYTKAFPEKGICSTALCDGPAGLRLQRVSALTKNGKIKPMEMMMDFMNSLPGFVKKLMTGDPKKDTLLYQNATAFPVGTALAQTWNQELIEKVGDAAGEEMEEYGVTFWLAPGMNIHRNPLCGRNYEYYSEDPVLSGKCAAAISRGVQSHSGCYVTIKHFAANNQETQRNRMSSNMDERTLREIYLEGFRIAVREGGAKAVMTSYNKLNHVYTPDSYDLCTKALRQEWGFDGVVMTDWMSTDKGLADRVQAYISGNDLLMPGGKGCVKEVKKAYQAGRLSEEVIRRCCRRLLVLVAKSGPQKEYFG